MWHTYFTVLVPSDQRRIMHIRGVLEAFMKYSILRAIGFLAAIVSAQAAPDGTASGNLIKEQITAWNEGDGVAYSRHFALASYFPNVLSSPQNPPTVTLQELPDLIPGKPIERQLEGRASHKYRVKLGPNQYARIVVDQRGVDVVVSLFSPAAQRLIEVDTPNGRWGPEIVIWVTGDFGGTFLLDVTSYDPKAPPGLYEARIDELRSATDQDRQRFSGQLAYEQGRLSWSRGEYSEAEAWDKRALAQLELAAGAQNPELVKVLLSLASTYESQERFSEAEPLFKRALEIREKTLGPWDAETALSCLGLAHLYVAWGKYVAADELMSRAGSISEKLQLPEDKVIARVLSNRADSLRDQKKLDESEILYRRELAIYEKKYGPNDESVGLVQASLARVSQIQGKNAEAEQLYLVSIPRVKRRIGPYHPDVAVLEAGLAEIYLARGAFSQAELLYKDALAIREKTLGPEHLEVAATLEGYAALCRKMVRDSDAAKMEARARAIRVKAAAASK